MGMNDELTPGASLLEEVFDRYGFAVPRTELEDLVQDIVTNETRRHITSPAGLDKTIASILDAPAITPADDDGILVLLFRRSGPVEPVIVRLGLMTEARLEAQIMPIFNAIQIARAKAHNEAEQARRLAEKLP